MRMEGLLMQECSGERVRCTALSNFLARVRQKLFKVFQKFSASSDPTAQYRVGSYTSLARFIFEKGHFSGNRVKPAAFTPPKSLELSGFLIDGLSETILWQIGDDVAGRHSRRALARADLKREDIIEVGLMIRDDPTPHQRHLNVCGWPNGKDKIKSVAIELCARALLRIRR